jgi:hypothetical protein
MRTLFVLAILFCGSMATQINAQVSVLEIMKRSIAVIGKLEEEDAQVLLFQVDHVGKGQTSSQTYSLGEDETYMIVALGDDRIEDIDLCVYDSDGDKVKCDADSENLSVVSFDVSSTQKYKFVVSPYKLASGVSDGFYGLIIARMK